MVTLKDLVGNYTLIPIPVQRIGRLFKTYYRQKKHTRVYLTICEEEVDSTRYFEYRKRFNKAFDQMTQSKNEYEKELSSIKRSFGIRK